MERNTLLQATQHTDLPFLTSLLAPTSGFVEREVVHVDKIKRASTPTLTVAVAVAT